MPAPGSPIVLQLRVVLRGISPLIWRRILVRSDSTIAVLHATLQLALGWSDDHLHRFVAHGREYGVEPNTAESGNRPCPISPGRGPAKIRPKRAVGG